MLRQRYRLYGLLVGLPIVLLFITAPVFAVDAPPSTSSNQAALNKRISMRLIMRRTASTHFVAQETPQPSPAPNRFITHAVDAYIAQDDIRFQEVLDMLLTNANSDSERTDVRDQVVRAIAAHIIGGLLGVNDAEVTIYRSVKADVDSDGANEVLIAGGTTEFFGIGACLLFDWHSNTLEHHILVAREKGFQNIVVRDVNQDGHPEILALWRAGSDATLRPYILRYDGNLPELLLDWAALSQIGFLQGNLEFKDLDADGVDEAVIWQAIFGDECVWCLHRYVIHVLVWQNNKYVLQRQLDADHTYSPTIISGRIVGGFGLPGDPKRNLQIQQLRQRIDSLHTAHMVTGAVVDDLLKRSRSFTNEKLYLEGTEVAEIALDAAESLSDPIERDMKIAASLAHRGYSLRMQGQYRAAGEDLRAAIDLLQSKSMGQIGDIKTYTWQLLNITYEAALNAYPFDAQSALRLFSRTASLAEQLDDPSAKNTVAIDIGNAYLLLHDFERALSYYQQTLNNNQQQKQPLNSIRSQMGMGYVAFASDNFEQAIKHFQEALTIAHTIGDTDNAAIAYRELGRSAFKQGQYDSARKLLEQALLLTTNESIRDSQGLVYIYLADVLLAQDQLEQAETYYQKLLSTYGATVTTSAGGTLWRAEYGLARVARSRSDTNGELVHLQAAIEQLERDRGAITIETLSTQFLNDQEKQIIYSALIRALHESGHDAEAFNYSERARARSLLDQLGSQRISGQAGHNPTLVAQEQKLREEIRSLEHQLSVEAARSPNEQDQDRLNTLAGDLAARRNTYEELLIKIKLEDPEYASLQATDPLTLPHAQALLDPQTTLVEYYVADDQVLAFVIRANDFQTIVLPLAAKQLTERVEYYRNLIQSHKKAEEERMAVELYNALIQPIQPHLTTPMVGIVPHRVLHYLPFQALSDGRQRLIEVHSLFYAPSVSVLEYTLKKRKLHPTTMLAFGNPTADRQPPLHYAEQEARSVAALFGSQAIVGSTATETLFKTRAASYQLLHIAAHGSLDAANPIFGAVYLAPDDTNDGRLEVHEIYELNLAQADQVVLSACQTQLGGLTSGDDLIGLSRAFIYAGAPSVVTSLWNIDDKATRVFMEHYYNYLRAGDSKAKALQKAQIDLMSMETYMSPYYWAAFDLIGDRGEDLRTAPTVPISTPERQEMRNNISNRNTVPTGFTLALLVVAILAVCGTLWFRRKIE